MSLIVSPAVNGLKKKNNDDGSVTLTGQVPEGFNKTGARFIVVYEGDTYTLPMAQTEFVIPSGKEKKTFNVEVRIILLILTESYRYKHLVFFIGRLVFFVFIFCFVCVFDLRRKSVSFSVFLLNAGFVNCLGRVNLLY